MINAAVRATTAGLSTSSQPAGVIAVATNLRECQRILAGRPGGVIFGASAPSVWRQ